MLRKVPPPVAIVCLGVLFFLVLLGCGKEPAPSRPVTDSNGSKAPNNPPVMDQTPRKESGAQGKEKATSLANKPADFTLDAKAWEEWWEKDKAVAAAKYQGKVVELSGVVDSADADPYGEVGYVYLKTTGKGTGVRCSTVDKEPWSKVSPGSKVKIRGIPPAAGGGQDGELEKCVITEAGPNPAIVTSARQLATDLAADPRAAEKKYDEKWVIADGDVASIKDKQRLILTGQGATQVPCTFGDLPGKGPLAQFKPGDKVKVFGRCYVFPDKKEIGLERCLLISR